VPASADDCPVTLKSNLLKTLLSGSIRVDAMIEHPLVRGVTLTGSGDAGNRFAAVDPVHEEIEKLFRACPSAASSTAAIAEFVGLVHQGVREREQSGGAPSMMSETDEAVDQAISCLAR